MQHQISPWSIYDRQFSFKKQSEPNKIPFYTPRQHSVQKTAIWQEQKKQSFYSDPSTMSFQAGLNKIIALKVIRAALGQAQAEGMGPCLPRLKGSLPIKRHLSNNHHHMVKDKAVRFRRTQQPDLMIHQSQQNKQTARGAVFDYDPFGDQKITQRKRGDKRNDSRFKFQTGIQFEMIKF